MNSDIALIDESTIKSTNIQEFIKNLKNRLLLWPLLTKVLILVTKAMNLPLISR